MFQCPHCEKPGISPLRKAILSPGLIATCKSFSRQTSIRYLSWLIAMLPGSALMIAALFVNSDSDEWSLNIIVLILMIVIPFLFTPLHREESMTPSGAVLYECKGCLTRELSTGVVHQSHGHASIHFQLLPVL